MAKLTLSFLLLFFVIAFSESSTPFDLPKEDVIGGDLPRSTPTILLPSEKPQSDAAAAVQIDLVTTATDSNSQDHAAVAVAEDRPASEPEKIATLPLRTVTFRPDDHGGFRERMVPLSLRFPFRHGGRGCHHGHRQFGPRFPGREISYGNDMILSESGPDPESRGIERQMAGRWIRVHHRKPRFGSVDVAWKEDEDMMNRPDRHEKREDEEEREHHHRRWKEDEDMMKRPDRHEEREDEEREHHHRRWKEDEDMMKRPHHEEHEDEEEREHHHRRWKEDEDMMKRPHHEEHEDEEEREHHHRRWKEDKDMIKRPDRHEEREDEEEREHHHRRWKEDKDMMKRPHRPEDREDDEEGEHHHHRRHHHFRRHQDHEDEEEERHGGEGIYKRIRKFLNHF